MGESKTPERDKLLELFRRNGYDNERVAVIPDALWAGLKGETYDVFAPQGQDKRGVLWYRGWTMLMPQSKVLVCTNSEVEPDGREDREGN